MYHYLRGQCRFWTPSPSYETQNFEMDWTVADSWAKICDFLLTARKRSCGKVISACPSGGGRGLVPSHRTPTPGPYPLSGPQKAGGSNRVKFLLKKYFVRICNTFFLQSGVEKSMCPFWNFLAFYWHFSWLQFEYFTIIQPISFYWDQHEMRRYTVIIVQYQVIKAPFTQIESDIAWICTMLLTVLFCLHPRKPDLLLLRTWETFCSL